VKAIATVAASAGCQLHITKITRCSSEGAIIADSLSKADFSVLRPARRRWDLPLDMATVPVSILAWLARPCLDEDLGSKILSELRKTQLVLGYNC
jgi:hypothetical protein